MKNPIQYLIIIASLMCVFYFATPIEPKVNYMKKQFLSSGLNLDYMDLNTSPKTDFYRYVNGNWLDSSEIPDDHSAWGGFYELRKKTDADVLAILKASVNDKTMDPNSDQGKVVSMYESFMDIEDREQRGVEPILPYLEMIESISDIDNLQSYMIDVSKYGRGDFFGIYVGADKKNSQQHSVYLYGGELGLPDRDYYLLESFQDIRDKYLLHVARMFNFLGVSEDVCETYAEEILLFETEIAKGKMDKVDRRDPSKTYNPRSILEIQEMLPMINWDRYLNGIGINPDTMIVSDLNYFNHLKII